MTYSRQFYQNLPFYARMTDESGFLERFCDVVFQTQLNRIFEIIDEQSYIYDPDNIAAQRNLDWLGLFVGLQRLNKHYLGIGIDPNWGTDQKIAIIKGAVGYWQTKTTESGIQKAIKLWLNWAYTTDPSRFNIHYPYGKRKSSFYIDLNYNSTTKRYDSNKVVVNQGDFLQGWWQWDLPYGIEGLQPYREKPLLGSGDYFGGHYVFLPSRLVPAQPPFSPQSDFQIDPPSQIDPLLVSDLDQIDPLFFVEVIRQSFVFSSHAVSQMKVLRRSQLGINNPWLSFDFSGETIAEWNQLFPALFTLNYEMLEVKQTPVVFGWFNAYINYPPPLIDLLGQIGDPRNWQLIIVGNNYSNVVGGSLSVIPLEYKARQVSYYWIDPRGYYQIPNLTIPAGQQFSTINPVDFIPIGTPVFIKGAGADGLDYNGIIGDFVQTTSGSIVTSTIVFVNPTLTSVGTVHVVLSGAAGENAFVVQAGLILPFIPPGSLATIPGAGVGGSTLVTKVLHADSFTITTEAGFIPTTIGNTPVTIVDTATAEVDQRSFVPTAIDPDLYLEFTSEPNKYYEYPNKDYATSGQGGVDAIESYTLNLFDATGVAHTVATWDFSSQPLTLNGQSNFGVTPFRGLAAHERLFLGIKITVNYSPGVFSFTATNYLILNSTAGDMVTKTVATIQRTNGSLGPAVMVVTLRSDSTAVNGSDYNSIFPLTVTFLDGQTSYDIDLPVLNKSSYEVPVTIRLDLGPPTGTITPTNSIEPIRTTQSLFNSFLPYHQNLSGINLGSPGRGSLYPSSIHISGYTHNVLTSQGFTNLIAYAEQNVIYGLTALPVIPLDEKVSATIFIPGAGVAGADYTGQILSSASNQLVVSPAIGTNIVSTTGNSGVITLAGINGNSGGTILTPSSTFPAISIGGGTSVTLTIPNAGAGGSTYVGTVTSATTSSWHISPAISSNLANIDGSYVITSPPVNILGTATITTITGNPLQEITVSLLDFTYSRPIDLGFLLVSPTGIVVQLFAGQGSNTLIKGVNLTFSSLASTDLAPYDEVISGTYAASALNNDFIYPDPAPQRLLTTLPPPAVNLPINYSVNMTDFLGEDPNGDWLLYVSNKIGGYYNYGGLFGGWEMVIRAPWP